MPGCSKFDFITSLSLKSPFFSTWTALWPRISLENFKQWSPFRNRQWEFHKSIIQIICYFSYFFLCIEQHTKQFLKKICMVTKDHKSACISWVQNPTCKLQSHCNEVTALTELFRQFYSFAMLYNTPSESEILLSPIYRQRKKQRDRK